MVAATEQAWRWIDRLGVPGPNPAEPLPPHIYVLATHVAASPERRPARVRVRAADGTWAVIRAAALPAGSQVPAGYAVTLEAARADDLAPLLMRAWRLTRREREVARLVIDGLSTESIATALFISVHTVRDHLKMIFGKMGVSRRQEHGHRPHRKNTHPGPCRPVIANAAPGYLRIARGPWARTLNAIRGAPSTTTTRGPARRAVSRDRRPGFLAGNRLAAQHFPVPRYAGPYSTGHTALDARSIQRDYESRKIGDRRCQVTHLHCHVP